MQKKIFEILNSCLQNKNIEKIWKTLKLNVFERKIWQNSRVNVLRWMSMFSDELFYIWHNFSMFTSIILNNIKKKNYFYIQHQNSHSKDCPNLTFALECFQRLSKHFLTMFNALITSSKKEKKFSSTNFLSVNSNKKFYNCYSIFIFFVLQFIC